MLHPLVFKASGCGWVFTMRDLVSFYKTVGELLQNDGHKDLSKFCNEPYMSDYVADHDNWDGGIDTFNIEIEVPVGIFSKWKSVIEGGIESQEKRVEEAFETAVRGINAIRIGHVTIRPMSKADDAIGQSRKPLSDPLHFEVQNKQGRRSDYIGSVNLPKRYPCFILVFNSDWTDYGYSTWFSLYYFATKKDKHLVGELKLMCSDCSSTIEALPEEFDEPLDDSFCSLGINTDYYIRLRSVLQDEYLIKEVLHYLCDCTFEPTIYDLHRDENIFIQSLMRDLSSMDAFKEGLALAMGVEPDDMYSFTYTFHPEYDTSLYADWSVRIPYNPLQFMRTIGIIGNNGVGKTQILSKFVSDLLGKDKFKFEALPHFKNLLVICSTPFDSYPAEPQEQSDIYYKMCCLEQDKTVTVQALRNNLSEVEKRPTVDNKSMLSLWKRLTVNYVDKNFINHVIKIVPNEGEEERLEIVYDTLEENIQILSSGQLHILSLVTYICAHIHYHSLLVIDEPEVHLHPHITMDFMAVLSRLLQLFKSYAIIATHSPLVVREMAGKNVFLMQKMQDGIPQIAPVAFETLGEDVTTLYCNLFGYDEKSSFFKKMVDELCRRGKNYEEIVGWFQRGVELNVNALLIIRDAIENRDNA